MTDPSPLRYALIEDEPLARSRMKRLMSRVCPESVCVAEAENGPEGLALIEAHGQSLDLLFLDIEFPPDGAFGLLEQLKQRGLPVPRIAFTTAYQQFAVEAFRWAACDYLLKPIEAARLAETLARIPPPLTGPNLTSAHPSEPMPPELKQLIQALQSVRESKMPERFTVHHQGKLLVLSWRQVTHITTESRLVFVHTARGRFVLERTLEELEQLLAPRFVRIHRSVLVAVQEVRELLTEPGGTGTVGLDGGVSLPVSRERLPTLRRILETS